MTDRIPSALLENILPDGHWEGDERVALNPMRDDKTAGSFKFNRRNGVWKDFAVDGVGGVGVQALACHMFPSLARNPFIAKYLPAEPAPLHLPDGAVPLTLPGDQPPAYSPGEVLRAVASAVADCPPDNLPVATKHRAIVPVPPCAPPIETYRIPDLGGAPSQLWPYRNADGGLVGYVARFEPAPGRKKYLPLSYCVDARWHAAGLPDPCPLYNLPEIIRRPDATILVAEGEKAADAAARLFPDAVATTSPGGADAAAKADWSNLAGRTVIIAPDCDDAGRKYAETVCALATAAGAARVSMLTPGAVTGRMGRKGAIPPGWDLADAEAEGLTAETAKGLLEAAAAAPEGAGPWHIELFDPHTSPDLSHDQLATDIGRAGWDRDARHVPDLGGWLLWDRERWKRSEARHVTMVRSFMQSKAELLIAWAEAEAGRMRRERTEEGDIEAKAKKLIAWARAQNASLRSKNTIMSVESLAQSNPASIAAPDQFDRDPMLLGTPAGTVDLRTGETRPADRADYITRQTAVAPAAPGTVPVLWLAFLDRIFAGDPELIALAQRIAGYSLTGLTTEHKLLFFYGTGRNGKGTFLRTMQNMSGDYAQSVPASVLLESRNGEHPTGLAGLRGARLAVGSELPAGKTWNEETIKGLTGGDVMPARFMRANYFEFVPQCTLIMQGNRKPSVKGVDEAMRARMVLVPFTVTIPEAERILGLADKLEPEWPAILRWAIDGAQEWQRIGLRIPASVRDASREYMDSEDHLAHFLEDETVADPAGRVTVRQMFVRHQAWQLRQGILHKWTQRATTSALRERGLNFRKSNGENGFDGIRFRPPPVDPQ